MFHSHWIAFFKLFQWIYKWESNLKLIDSQTYCRSLWIQLEWHLVILCRIEYLLVLVNSLITYLPVCPYTRYKHIYRACEKHFWIWAKFTFYGTGIGITKCILVFYIKQIKHYFIMFEPLNKGHAETFAYFW